jgi:glyoxylase-like metal-dependent hydrolase (beta-lactamase superfamily II)
MSALTAKVRMYRLNELGDCFLITFTEGDQVSRMLIDCGSFRNGEPSKKRLQKIAADIKKELGAVPLSVVVGTHQHNDHLSGFVHCKDVFESIGVEQVWLSWLDDPKDKAAKKIGDRFHNLRASLFGVQKQLASMPGAQPDSRTRETLDDALTFFGPKAGAWNVSGPKGAAAPPLLPTEAVAILRKLGRRTCYLHPGQVLDMPGLTAGKVKIYVLGPPRDTEQLYRANPRKGESYETALASKSLAAEKFLNATKNQQRGSVWAEDQYPFNEPYKRRGGRLQSSSLRDMVERYSKRTERWRRIDADWMNQAETLALFLDTYTNNSSLVLAIELVETRKVLLFAADAQIGNWTSWKDVKWDTEKASTDDLLARTVFYKVGHHGSHNSTLATAFEKMTHGDLAALIPVHKQDPNIKKKVHGWKMPAGKLLEKLRERTSNRVLQMDGVNAEHCDPEKEPAISAWKNIHIRPNVTDMFIELEFSTAPLVNASRARPQKSRGSSSRRRA